MRGIVLAVLVAASTASSLEPLEGEVPTLSRFERTVRYLQDSPPEERADFAAAALTELTAVYMAEADLARSEASERQDESPAKLLGWSLAVDQYANQLLLVLDDVEQGFPVSLRRDPQGPVTTTVADRAVILGHPRADQQAAFELRVLTDFCSSHDCERMTVTTAESAPIPVSAVRVNPLWTFTEAGPVCSNDSIEVRFRSDQNLAGLRGLCEGLFQEFAALAMDLAWQIRHGVAIDWDSLVISATPGRPEHLVRLNSTGDSVLVTVPLLFASTELLADIKPWLFARATGSKAATTRLDAAKYGWVSPSQ